ncbi:MAG TPA: aminotransferase class V-fold PLP-dependent enzyme [Longimicrobiales bacterium]
MTDAIAYLDYAATAAVRPPAVTAAVTAYLERVGATPGRGGHRLAVEAGRVVLRCRRALARLLGIPGDPGRIAFTFNGTHALNTALRGTLREGDAVVVTAFDHNAVLRPAYALAAERRVDVRMVPGAPDGSLDLDAAARLLDGARLLVVNAASNVLGVALPVGELSRLAHDAGAWVLVDAAQVAGHRPLDVEALGIDLLAFTGHKGLLGPQGTGGLWVREGIDVQPFLHGGTGGDSMPRTMPPAYPDHLEAGTLNGPGIAGLGAGVEWILEHTVDAVHRHTMELKSRLWEGLRAVPGVRVLSPAAEDGVAIVTMTAETVEAAALARRLDAEHGVLCRAGLHCAPEVHAMLGTTQSGAVRFSLGWASTMDDVHRAVDAVARVIRG